MDSKPPDRGGLKSRREMMRDTAAGLAGLTIARLSSGTALAQELGVETEKGLQERSIPTFENFSRSLNASLATFVQKFRAKYPEASSGNAGERWTTDRERFAEFQKAFGEEVAEREMQKLYDRTLRSSGSTWYNNMMREIGSFTHLLSTMGARSLPSSSPYSAEQLVAQLNSSSTALKKYGESIGIANSQAYSDFSRAEREYFNLLQTIASVKTTINTASIPTTIADDAGKKQMILHGKAIDLARANDQIGKIYTEQQGEGSLLRVTRDLLGLTKR